jgi:hypothetical protein
MDNPPSAGRGFQRTFIRILLISAALLPLGYAIYAEWPAVQAALGEIEWGGYTFALLILIAILILKGTIPWMSLQQLGVNFSVMKSSRIYFFTQIFKYLPGGVWAFPGRMAVYQYLGVARTKSVVSVFREMTAEFLGAALVGLLGVLRGLPISNPVRTAITVGVLASVGVIFLTQTDWFWRTIRSFSLFRSTAIADYIEADSNERSIAWLPRTLILSLTFWLLLGFPVRQMAIAVHPDIEAFSFIDAASMFALAWCAGFVVVLIPAGIGVREGAFAFLLSTVMPVGAALSLALMMRVAWVLTEGIWILLTLIWSSKGTELSLEAFRGGKGID